MPASRLSEYIFSDHHSDILGTGGYSRTQHERTLGRKALRLTELPVIFHCALGRRRKSQERQNGQICRNEDSQQDCRFKQRKLPESTTTRQGNVRRPANGRYQYVFPCRNTRSPSPGGKKHG